MFLYYRQLFFQKIFEQLTTINFILNIKRGGVVKLVRKSSQTGGKNDTVEGGILTLVREKAQTGVGNGSLGETTRCAVGIVTLERKGGNNSARESSHNH